jgi:hypothetical protein
MCTSYKGPDSLSFSLSPSLDRSAGQSGGERESTDGERTIKKEDMSSSLSAVGGE